VHFLLNNGFYSQLVIGDLSYDKLHAKFARFIEKLSGLCLGAYLISWIFDSLLYPKLLEKVPYVIYRLEYYIIIVPLSFVLSLAASYLLNLIQTMIEKFISIVTNYIKGRVASRALEKRMN